MLALANSFHTPLKDKSVHCAITSPPYFGLRDYGLPPQIFGGERECQHIWGEKAGEITRRESPGVRAKQIMDSVSQGQFCQLCNAWRGSLGNEPIIDLYVQHLVEVCREVWRALRDDGIFWLNLGDSYASSGTMATADERNATRSAKLTGGKMPPGGGRAPTSVGLKPKDLCGIPWRVALALQADGWYLRRDIIWHKLNPMPESVTDRPSTAHEYVFMLTKKSRYFWDMEAVRESSSDNSHGGKYANAGDKYRKLQKGDGNLGLTPLQAGSAGRNIRSVWPIATQPYSIPNENWADYDYVGPNGKPYKASPDCPIHGHLVHLQKSDTLECDEQSIDEISSHNLDSDVHHDVEPFSLQISKTSHESLDAAAENAQRRMPESKSVNKISDHHPLSILDEKTQPHTGHKLEVDESPVYNLDSQTCDCSQTAKPHNTQTHKTDLSPETSPSCTSFAETSDHTDDMSMLPENTEHVSHSPANKNEEGYDANETVLDPSGQTSCHTTHKKVHSSSNCTCKPSISQVDHFAVFPPKLVEPMIKSSTSQRGVCGECGAQWVRVVEKGINIYPGSSHDHSMDREQGNTQTHKDGKPAGTIMAQRWYASTPNKTTGWQPSCNCNAPVVPAIVFDPFTGSGTVGEVCRNLNRRFIGLDLSAEYLAINALPRAEGKTSQKAIEELPLFKKDD